MTAAASRRVPIRIRRRARARGSVPGNGFGNCNQWSERIKLFVSIASLTPVARTGLSRSGCRGTQRHLPWSSAPFGEIRPGDCYCVGLPRRRHPLPEFLTLPAALPHLSLVALFRATSAHRLSGLQSFSHQNQRCHLSAHPALLPLGRHEVTNLDFRALVRPGVRHSGHAVNVGQSRCSPGLLPLRGLPDPVAAEALPSRA